MADTYVGEIRIMAFKYAPVGWASCDGQLLSISQNTALFALLGTAFGGNGKTTFALPNLAASVPIGTGDGKGLSPRAIGEQGGEEGVTLTLKDMPSHTHTLNASDQTGENPVPTGNTPARYPGAYQSNTAGLQPMSPLALAIAGGSLPHNNYSPFLTLQYCIAMQGVFPPRG